MFSVTRTYPEPSSLCEGKYNTHEVVRLLEQMFHGKCYLCERDRLQDPEIEHLDPHEGDSSKKYAWHNLYYACSRCNSIKSTTYRNIIDCCDNTINLFRAIKCILPSIPNGEIIVSIGDAQPCPELETTISLLRACYNETNTALRIITRSALIEDLFEHYNNYLTYRSIIRNKKSNAEERTYATGRLKSMLSISFPFSVFWRWHLLSDDLLKRDVPELINF